MAISNAPATVAINTLQSLPFSSMIGGPLQAAIEAQAMAAKTTWDFIQQVGLNTDKDGQRSAINVSFSFMQDGRMVQLNVPLLTIVPIPYIAIRDIDIDFKATINASANSYDETTESTSKGGELNVDAKLGFACFKTKANLKANYSSKKDSKSTQDSKYSIESTIDVKVKAGQDSMPAGLSKVLELLGNSLDVSDVKGTLEVSAETITGPTEVYVSYKNKDGLFEPSAIKLDGSEAKGDNIKELGDGLLVTLDGKAEKYEFTAGERSVTVKVVAEPAKKDEQLEKKPAQP